MATAREPVIQVTIVSLEGVVFEGVARTLTLPGEQGTFEVLPLHRPLVSRLLAGPVTLDGRTFPIRRGVVRVADDIVTALVEFP